MYFRRLRLRVYLTSTARRTVTTIEDSSGEIQLRSCSDVIYNVTGSGANVSASGNGVVVDTFHAGGLSRQY
jgi:hypothetical protein